MAPPRFDRRMSPAEALMWRLERDPALSSNVANVTILDRPLDLDRFRRRMERAVATLPRLRQRVRPSAGGLAPPVFADDPAFDLRYHVRGYTLPQPATDRDLFDLATRLNFDPFDDDRPLWLFVAVDGLPGGRGALLQKMHHTITDGEGAMRLSLQFLDLERDHPEPDDPIPEVATEPEPSSWDDLVAGPLRLPVTLAGRAASSLTDPGRLLGAAGQAVGSAGAVVRQLRDTDPARSPLWQARTTRRHLEVLRVPFAPVKEAAHRYGGSLNDAFLTAAAAGAGAYHRHFDAPVETLNASMAISTRTKESGANAFSVVRLAVPTGEMSVEERFANVVALTSEARSGGGGAGLDLMAQVAATLPGPIVRSLARSQTGTVDFATSNIRAAAFTCYIAGARILENYAIGPLAGVAFNLTLLSYDGSLDMGMHVDPVAVQEPALLRDLLLQSFDELVS